MTLKGVLMTAAAGAAMGLAAGVALEETGMIDGSGMRRQLRRAAKALEDVGARMA
jgi:hypothetical protein